jgi:hypothetical protein
MTEEAWTLVMSIEPELGILAGPESEVPLVFKGDPSLTAGDAVLERGSGTRAANDGDAAWSRARGNELLLPGGVEFVGDVVCEETV